MESLPGPDWQDDGIEDPWDIEFPPNKKTPRPSKSRKAPKRPRVPEVYPIVDESGLYSKVGNKEFQCHQCPKYF